MLITGDVRALCRDAVDMRKSIDGLSYLVQPLLAQNPLLCGEAKYVAANREHVSMAFVLVAGDT
ncbi:IS66 family insertion sequence element accessory protein TnpB [Cupriavidus lacunae]|uniref:Uncharacterized protein n=1 Tax=Cupriavidus lacunae TaxID=2666307 RepID=A0A370NL18_9BURK|nr:IS66 family insertion sequence element accessory protein TnpB [Cupriavidus lacunae]RDK06299.1 hypothetical protein DN412_32040 [Cupriavidus lacunae]